MREQPKKWHHALIVFPAGREYFHSCPMGDIFFLEEPFGEISTTPTSIYVFYVSLGGGGPFR